MKKTNQALRLALAAALLSTPFMTIGQDAKPATLQEALAQIESLRKQMNDLEKLVKTQLQQTPPPASTPLAATAVTALAATPPPAPDSGFVKWNELMVGKSHFKLYGFLRADAVYDDSRTGGNGLNSALIPATVLSENGRGGAANLAPQANHDSFVIHPRLTRFGIDFTGPEIASLWGAKTGGKIEVDFYNIPAGAAESREFLRLRHGYLSLKWDEVSLLAGQTSDLISQNYPIVNPDFVMWGAGNLGDRRPQFRLEYTPKLGSGTGFVQIMAGLTGADDNRDLDANGIRDGEASGQPTLQARAGYRFPIWEKQNLEIAAWGHHASERVDAGLPAGGKKQFSSDAVGIDFSTPLYKDWLSFKTEVWKGRNIDDIRGGILQGINAANGKLIHAEGGWAELTLKPCKQYAFSAGYTVDNPDNSDLPGQAPSRNRVWYLANRLNFDPIEIGIDYLNWTTDYKDPAGRGKGQDNRFQAYISYKF